MGYHTISVSEEVYRRFKELLDHVGGWDRDSGTKRVMWKVSASTMLDYLLHSFEVTSKALDAANQSKEPLDVLGTMFEVANYSPQTVSDARFRRNREVTFEIRMEAARALRGKLGYEPPESMVIDHVQMMMATAQANREAEKIRDERRIADGTKYANDPQLQPPKIKKDESV